MRRLIKGNDIRLAADCLPNAKYEFGLMIKWRGKTADLISRIRLCHSLTNCHFQLVGELADGRPDAGGSLITAVLVLVWSENSVEMRGEERDAEATLVHAT